MPIYEYVCEQDGTLLELIRPMADADAPVKDPDNKGRTFTRKHSTFAPGSSSERSLPQGCCPCGKPGVGCGGRG